MPQLQIALCQTGVKNKTARLENITINELAKLLQTIEAGEKDGSYFIRTGVIDETKGRSDSNTQSTANILILDADSTINSETGEITEGAPCPYEVHEALKAKGVNHFICRSYSHEAKGNRYRIVLKTATPYSKSELPETVNHALFLCAGVAPVKENNTWSQPWYIPRKPKGDNSSFTYLAYKAGNYLSVQQPQPDFDNYAPKAVPHELGQHINPIEAYNNQARIEDELTARGDTRHGNKWMYHGSSSKEPGITVKDNKMFSHHGSDPLNDGRAHDCFDVMRDRLGLTLNGAIKHAATHTLLDNGKTVDAVNKADYKNTLPQTPPEITFNALDLFKDAESPPVLPVPFDALPETVKAWTDDVSSRIGCAADYLIVGILTVLSWLVGRKVLIKPKQRHDWVVTPNLYGAIIGRPSTKKSPALNETLYYINSMEAQARLENEEANQLYKLEVRLAKYSEKAAQRSINSELKISKEAGLRELQKHDAESIKKPVDKRFIVHNTTVEKFAMLMPGNPNGLLIVRDEISGLLSELDRDEFATSREFYLQMFNGNQSYSYDRVSRDDVYIPHCVGSILGGIQPAKLQRYLMPTASGNNDDGLMQRIQLIVYPDAVISTGKDEYPDKQAKENLTEMFDYFAQLPEGEPVSLNFTQDAQQIFYNWEKDNTDKARKEQSSAMESHLSKYPAFVASLALIIHLADNQTLTPVSKESLLKAIGLAEYFESQSRRVYSMASLPDAPARSLANNLHKLNNPFKPDDFKTKGWSGLRDSAGRKEALAILVARGYLAAVKTPVANSKRSMVVYYKNELLVE